MLDGWEGIEREEKKKNGVFFFPLSHPPYLFGSNVFSPQSSSATEIQDGV